MTPLLELRDVDAGYDRLQVLFGVSLDVAPGARLALLGTNGAGKSTVLRVVAGLLAPSAGSVRIDGQDVSGWSPRRRHLAGVATVAGGRATFPGLTVRENLAIGSWDRGAVADERLAHVFELFPRLRDRLSQPAGTLSGGEQQMLALGRTLLGEPRLLLVDELSLGLAPVVVAEVVDAVREICRRGTTVVLVEQSLNVARTICDDALFLEKGEVRFRGPIDELADRGDLARSVFFGASAR